MAENVKLEGILAKKELLVVLLAHEERFSLQAFFNKGKG